MLSGNRTTDSWMWFWNRIADFLWFRNSLAEWTEWTGWIRARTEFAHESSASKDHIFEEFGLLDSQKERNQRDIKADEESTELPDPNNLLLSEFGSPVPTLDGWLSQISPECYAD